MDPIELLKAAPALQKIVATIVAGVPIAEIVKRIVLPSADALGERMKNRVERCFDKAGTMILNAQATPQPPTDKLIIEILQGASLEEDEDLHTMWAALLANAASPENAGKVRPGFIATLKQMAPDEAALLKTTAETTEEYLLRTFQAPTKAALDRKIAARNNLQMNSLRESFVKSEGEEESATENRFLTCLEVLDNTGLIEIGGSTVMLSLLGKAFLDACRPPKPKS